MTASSLAAADTSDFDLLVILTQPPLTGLTGREGLDTALVSATFEQKTALLFLGEGVLQLAQKQDPAALALKGTQARLKALPLYDLDAVFAEKRALKAFNLDAEGACLLAAQALSAASMQALFARCHNILVF